MERTDAGTEHETWKERTRAGTVPTDFNDERAGGRHHWVPEPTAALGKERHKTLPGQARELGPPAPAPAALARKE
jgi:dihydropyrimidine dehydrogenase (NAD+) subunit PreA